MELWAGQLTLSVSMFTQVYNLITGISISKSNTILWGDPVMR